MRVPVRRQPNTRVTPITEGFQRAQPTPDFSPITNVIRGFAKDLEDQQRGMEEFDLQKRLMQETNDLQADFAKRKEEAPLGAAGFTDSVLADYEARHTAILDEYDAKGYDRGLLQNTAVRLGSLRQQFGERALGFQSESTRGLATKNIEEFKVGVSQYVTNNPFDGWESGVAEYTGAVDRLPGLTAVERETLKQNGVNELRSAAAKGAALANPQLIIQKLDPKGLTAPAAVSGAPGGAYGILKGWQAVPTTVAAKYGLDATEVAAVMSFESAGTFNPGKKGGDGGRYQGLIQAGPEERAKYGIDPSLPPEEYAAALIRFFDDRGFKPGMGIEDFYSTILTGSPGNYDRQDSNGTSVRKVIKDITTGAHRKNAEKWLRAAAPMQDANALGAEPASLNPFDPGASQVPAAPDLASLTPEQVAQEDPRTTKTGIALLDAMNGAERLQVLGWAREKTNQQTTQVKGAMDVAVANKIEANLRNGEDAGSVLTREQVVGVYGAVEGEQKWAAIESAQATGSALQKMRTLSQDEIASEVEKLKPDPNSPTYATEVRYFDAAQKAQSEILTQRADDPAGYVFQAFPDIRKAAESAQTSGERIAVYGQMIRAYDKLGTPRNQRYLMTDDQIEALGDRYKTARPADKVEILNTLLKEMGPVTAGATLGRAAGRGVGADFQLYATYRDLPNPRGVLGRVFAGRDIIAKDPSRRPSREAINKTFAGQSGLGSTINVLDPDVSSMMNEAAAALYVEKGGRTENGQVDRGLYAEALREAVGGMGGQEDTGFYSDRKGAVKELTILPPSVTGKQFEAWQNSLQPGSLTRISVNGKPPVYRSGRPVELEDILDDGVFVMRYPGVYGIKMASDGKFIADSSGRAFEVRVDKRTVRGR